MAISLAPLLVLERVPHTAFRPQGSGGTPTLLAGLVHRRGQGCNPVSGPAGNWDALTAEMRRYEYAIGPTGGITYSAPCGYHDDCVMALALANHRRWESETTDNMLTVGGGSGRVRPRMGRRELVLMG